MAISTQDMLTLLQDVASQVIDPRFRALRDEEIATKTRPDDYVTVADREAEVLLTRALTAAYPGAMVLGEEAVAADRGLLGAFTAAEHALTVDPVDGTRNFVAGSPDHAVMVGEVRGGLPVRAWIWQPQHEAAYVAERGAGAWRNGERLTRTGVPADPAEARILTTMRSLYDGAAGPIEVTGRSWGSCGIDYPRLATGECDALVYRGTQPWDHVPGCLLTVEAGGALGRADGDPYEPRVDHPGLLVAAASPALLAAIQDAL